MQRFNTFTPEEDEFIRTHFSCKLSRLAIRLNRPYFMMEQRCIFLGLLSDRITNDKYYTDDEIEFNLLFGGCSEEEIKKLKGTRCVFAMRRRGATGVINDDA